MSNEWTTIPFAYELSTGNFVDVHEVANGAACGCICPSCSVPLVARQGSEKQWHFAHESRGTHEQAREECEYSVYVAIKLMARQLLAHGSTSLAMPELTVTESLVDRQFFLSLSETGTVARAQVLTVEGWRIEETVHGTKVDAIGVVGNHQLALLFDYGV